MKTRPRQFSGSSFCCSRTFRASFARGKIIFHALFLCWFTFDAHFRSARIGQNWQLCRLGVMQGALEAEFKFLRADCKLSLLFRPAARAPRKSLPAILPELASYKLPEMTLWKGSKQKKLVDEKGSVVASGSVYRFWHVLVLLNKL